MSSQRHKLENYGSTSAGELHAQGVVSPAVLDQVVDPSNYNALMPSGREGEGFVVPVGPPGGPLQGSSMSGAVPEELQPPPPPDPELAPVVTSIDPTGAAIGDPDLTLTVTGEKFVDGSLILFNNSAEETVFVSETELTTTVKPSTASVAGAFPVAVRNPDGQESSAVDFTFTDGAARSFPVGPINIATVTDHDNGIAVVLVDAADVQVGDSVTIEATGNTSINGTYEVLEADGTLVVVDNPYVLPTPIEAKGRLTVVA